MIEGDSTQTEVQVIVDIPPDFPREVFLSQIDLEDFSPEEIEDEIAAAASDIRNNNGNENEQEEDDQTFHSPRLSEAIKCLQVFRDYLQSSGTATKEDMHHLSRLENKALKDKIVSREGLLSQKKISSFFTKEQM